MTLTRFPAYSPKQSNDDTPYWSMLEFFNIRMKGRKVLKMIGVDEIHTVAVEQMDNQEADSYIEHLYDVAFHGYDEEEKAFIIEVIATKNNKVLSKSWSHINLWVTCHVANADLDLKEYKGEVKNITPHPRLSKSDPVNIKSLPAENTTTEDFDNPLAFLG